MRRRLKSRKVSNSCGCTAEDCEYEVQYIVVIWFAPLAYGFINTYILCCARQRVMEMFLAVILLIDYVEIIKA